MWYFHICMHVYICTHTNIYNYIQYNYTCTQIQMVVRDYLSPIIYQFPKIHPNMSLNPITCNQSMNLPIKSIKHPWFSREFPHHWDPYNGDQWPEALDGHQLRDQQVLHQQLVSEEETGGHQHSQELRVQQLHHGSTGTSARRKGRSQ